MNDPHVVALIYSVRHSGSVNYGKAAPLAFKTAVFTVRVENDEARFEMVEHFASVEVARDVVATFVREWEVSAALDRGPGEFDLVFKDAEIVDRQPTPGALYARGITAGVPVLGTPSLTLWPDRYPAPPVGIAVNDDVDAMLARYLRYKEGREPISGMAYFCLTVVERLGGRSGAATTLAISGRVLARLGELSGRAGGPDARKAIGLAREYTTAERKWLDHAVNKLIRRTAEVAGQPGATLPQITMADLPPL